MKTRITLTERELQQAVREYVEHNSRHTEEVDAEAIGIQIDRNHETGEFEAVIEFSETV